MKNLFSLIALVAGFTFIANTTLNAQNFIRNYTSCEYVVKVGYGDASTCTVDGYLSVTVPPTTQFVVNMPNGTDMVIVKGTPNPGTADCPFYVGEMCTQYPYTDNVTCSTACGDYTAELVPGFGVLIQ